jgi:hypothetical protein
MARIMNPLHQKKKKITSFSVDFSGELYLGYSSSTRNFPNIIITESHQIPQELQVLLHPAL